MTELWELGEAREVQGWGQPRDFIWSNARPWRKLLRRGCAVVL